MNVLKYFFCLKGAAGVLADTLDTGGGSIIKNNLIFGGTNGKIGITKPDLTDLRVVNATPDLNKYLKSISYLPKYNRFVIGGSYGAYWSDDLETWTRVSLVDNKYSGAGEDDYYNKLATYIPEIERLIIVAKLSTGVATTQDGINWTIKHPSGNGMHAPVYIPEEDKLISGEQNGGIVYSTDKGLTWSYKNMQSNTYKPSQRLAYNSKNKCLYAKDWSKPTNIIVSEDYGSTWKLLKTVSTELNVESWVYVPKIDRIVTLDKSKDTVKALDSDGNVYIGKKRPASGYYGYFANLHYFNDDDHVYVIHDNSRIARVTLDELATTNKMYPDAPDMSDYVDLGNITWNALTGA